MVAKSLNLQQLLAYFSSVESLNASDTKTIPEIRLSQIWVVGEPLICQSQSNKGPNTRGKKGPLRLVFCGALAGVLVI